MAGKLYALEEVAANRDKTPVCQQTSTVAANAISIVLPAVAGESYYLHHIMLSKTAGGGANETLAIAKGATGAWTETFTIGTDREQPFYGLGFVGNEGESVTITASATALTAATLSVVGYRK